MDQLWCIENDVLTYIVESFIMANLRPIIGLRISGESAYYCALNDCVTLLCVNKHCLRLIGTFLERRIDWLKIGLRRQDTSVIYNIEWELKEGILDQDIRTMLKRIALCEARSYGIRRALDDYMSKHGIVYRTKGSGKIYRGYVGMRKLKTLVVKPALTMAYKTFFKLHDKYHKKNRELKTYLQNRNKLLKFRYVNGKRILIE
jgi:hypothetical protein